MELREPPHTTSQPATDRTVRALLIVILVAVLAMTVLLIVDREGASSSPADADHVREVASKLKAAGALDQAAELYGQYLALSQAPAEDRAKIAYSLGTTYLEQGALSQALRWFYEAETLGAGALAGEVDAKIVHTLERMGRFHAAKAALDAGTGLASEAPARSVDDPVVARIGSQEIHRSDVDRALDELPPQVARSVTTPEQRQEFLQQYVANELLWRKASKLEYDKDPEVLRAHANLLKQLAVSAFVEKELAASIEVDEADLENFFKANTERYQRKAKEGEEPVTPSFAEVRQMVERDYRLMKIEQAYNDTVASELATEDVELHPERMVNGT